MRMLSWSWLAGFIPLALSWADQRNAMRRQLADDLRKIRQASPQAVQFETDDDIQPAPSSNFIGSGLTKFMLRQIRFTRAQIGSLIVRIGSLPRRFFRSEA
jgi:hypothetical protein